MAKREIKTIFAIDGEQKYKDAIKSINKEQSLLRAEMKAATSQFDASGDSQKKLAAQADSLAKQIELQKKKVTEAQNAVEQANRIYGEADDRTKNYKIQLANAEAQLGRMQTELAKTNKELILQNDSLKKTGEALEKTGQKMKTVGEGMEKAGKGLTVGVTAPVMTAGAGLLELGNRWDDAEDTIRIGTGAVGEALGSMMDDFEAVIDKVPADMGVAANVIADINTRLGLTGKPLQELSQQYLELAHITGEDVTASITESTRAFQAWRTPAERMGEGLDMLFKVSQTTGIGVNELTKKVTDFAPALQELGFTFDESVTLIGKFEQAGVNVDASLGAMKRGLASFAKEGKSASEGMTEVTASIKSAKTESEAAKIAMEVFGSRAGPELAHQIRAGKFDIDELTKSIVNNNETINKAATDTYDYAEEWKMLTNSLAKDLKPVAGQVFDAINSATPILKDAAKWVGDLAQRFSELSPQQQETVLKMAALAAAAGPVLSITSKLTTTIGGATEGIGKFITKLAEKKAAEEAAKLATEGMSGAIGAGTSLLGPAAIAIGAVTLAVVGLNAAYQEGIRPAKEAGDAAEAFVKGLANWHDGVEQATSALQGFNMETIISNEKMAELEDGIRTAQANILEIAQKAAEESRAYTEEERKQIEELVGLIADYTAKKIEAYQQQAQVVAAMATQERDITIERANELIKAAEEARGETLAIAQARYAEQIAIAEETYGHLGELDKESYDEMVKNAQNEYEQQTSSADKTYGDTLAIIQQSYIDQNEEAKNHLAKISEINDELNSLEDRKTKFIAEKTEQRKKELKSETLNLQEQSKITMGAEAWASDERRRLLEELKQAYQGAQDSNADAWIGMAADAELYGGQIAKDTKELATGFIDNIENLPEDSKKVMADTMNGMSSEMEKKEPSLFRKASNIAGGILNSLRKAFDIRSPSHKMQEITEQLFAGADKPMQEAEKKLPEKMGKVADNVLLEAARMSETELYLANRASELSIKPMTAPKPNDMQQMSQPPLSVSAREASAESLSPVVVENMHVRNESDIHKIANELYKLQQRKKRGLGMA